MKKKLIYEKNAYQATFIKKLCELNFFNWIFFFENYLKLAENSKKNKWQLWLHMSYFKSKKN